MTVHLFICILVCALQNTVVCVLICQYFYGFLYLLVVFERAFNGAALIVIPCYDFITQKIFDIILESDQVITFMVLQVLFQLPEMLLNKLVILLRLGFFLQIFEGFFCFRGVFKIFSLQVGKKAVVGFIGDGKGLCRGDAVMVLLILCGKVENVIFSL